MKSKVFYLVAFMLCYRQLYSAQEQKYQTPPPEFFASNSTSKANMILPGDVLTVRFHYNPEMNKTVKVRDDGKISLDLFQGISVIDLTPEQLQTKLIDLYSREYTKPEITVDLDSRANSSVYVTGEVLLPGAKELRGKLTVGMVLAMGQVNQKTAGTKSVFLTRAAEPGKYLVYKLDASVPFGIGGNIEVAPGDILFVPRKGIVKADDFIEQWVRQLLPASPSASASVLFTPGQNVYTSASTTAH